VPDDMCLHGCGCHSAPALIRRLAYMLSPCMYWISVSDAGLASYNILLIYFMCYTLDCRCSRARGRIDFTAFVHCVI